MKNINLTVFKGDRVGVVGPTGSGKSTLIDLLMGLLQPTTGNIFIDDVEINKANLKQWQRQIAHVPQSVFLTDGTIKDNIAFGEKGENLDISNIRIAAQKACLSETVSQMNMGFDTPVGERGVQLSGGQRQRIGIARAIYKNKKIFCF